MTVQTMVENLALNYLKKTRSDYQNFDDMIEEVIPFIFEDFPIFDETYRTSLCIKIIRHYFFREIVVAPFSRWQFYLTNDMREKMPYFNQLYESTLLKYDVFENINITETLDRDLSGEQIHDNEKIIDVNDIKNENDNRTVNDKLNSSQEQSSTSSNETKSVFEDTPYSQLGSTDYATNITNEKDDNVNNGEFTGEQIQLKTDNKTITANNTQTTSQNTNAKSNTTNTEDYIKKITGKNNGFSNPKILMEFRSSLLNVDEMVIKALNDNFSGYYN